MQLVPELGISYHVGVDGIAALLMLLTGVLGPLVVLASLDLHRPSGSKEFHLALLVLQTAMLGALCVARPHPLLRLLGGDAHPDVPAGRACGARGARRWRR